MGSDRIQACYAAAEQVVRLRSEGTSMQPVRVLPVMVEPLAAVPAPDFKLPDSQWLPVAVAASRARIPLPVFPLLCGAVPFYQCFTCLRSFVPKVQPAVIVM